MTYSLQLQLGVKYICIQLSLGICWGLVPGLPQVPNSKDAQVPYKKWQWHSAAYAYNLCTCRCTRWNLDPRTQCIPEDREVMCSQTETPLSPKGHVTAHAGVSTRGLLSRELRTEVLLARQDLFLHKLLGWELLGSRTKAFKNWGLTVLCIISRLLRYNT